MSLTETDGLIGLFTRHGTYWQILNYFETQNLVRRQLAHSATYPFGIPSPISPPIPSIGLMTQALACKASLLLCFAMASTVHPYA